MIIGGRETWAAVRILARERIASPMAMVTQNTSMVRVAMYLKSFIVAILSVEIV
jgi:hypothetical protein